MSYLLHLLCCLLIFQLSVNPKYLACVSFSFCITLVFWSDNFLGVIIIQMLITMGVILIILSSQPFESRLIHKMEIYTEVTTMLSLYIMMTFSDYIRSN